MSGVVVGLDYGAVLAMATAQRADVELLSEVLPEVEGPIIAAMNGEPEED